MVKRYVEIEELQEWKTSQGEDLFFVDMGDYPKDEFKTASGALVDTLLFNEVVYRWDRNTAPITVDGIAGMFLRRYIVLEEADVPCILLASYNRDLTSRYSS